MTVRVYNRAGALIHTSRNLRGLMDHARRAIPIKAALAPHPVCDGYYLLTVTFESGDYCTSKWADWTVCADWLWSRRSWGKIEVTGNPAFVERYK